jgi:L-iditol 2-dehydrogenase
MKAAVLEGVDRIDLKDVEKPACTPDTILVRVDACAVCGTDVKALRHGHHMIEPPIVLGHELAGTIVEVGDDVHGYYDSERVTVAPAVPCGVCHYCRRGHSTVCENLLDIGSCWDGGFAEYMLVPPAAVRAASVNKVPGGVSSAAAALTEPLACCLNAQEMLGVGAGDNVLVIGSGPIGCLNAMLARTLGAARVIMADVDAHRLELAEAADADVYVNSAEKDLKEKVLARTSDRGADVVIVACPSAEAQQQAMEYAAPRARVNFFGGLPKGSGTIDFDSNRLHYQELTVLGNHGSTPDQNYRALQLIASGHVAVEKVITHRFMLDQIEEAIGTAERKEGLKVVVLPHQ